MKKTLNIVGCGNVGKTLGRLWYESGIFTIGGIVNTSMESAEQAAAFIGAGTACASVEDLPDAGITMIGTPDSLIGETAKKVTCPIVFHCSGALPSSILQGDAGASVHPVRSFVDPAESSKTFAGTMCGVEGSPQALEVLEPAIKAIGGETFPVKAEAKTLYHAAAVFICNYLPPLMETGYKLYEDAGVPRETATKIMKPIVGETVTNIFGKGTADALTGPIARGDVDVVKRQLLALYDYDGNMAELYRLLGAMAANLSGAPEDTLEQIKAILKNR